MPASESEALKHHLHECPSCSALLRSPSAPSEAATQGPAAPASSEDATVAPDPRSPAIVNAEHQGRHDFLAPAEGPDEIGRLGPYRILQVLGSGGMGVVFRAENLQLGRMVALKVMLPAMAAAPSARERFLREARTAASIEHENVVTIYHVGEDRGVPYLAMQLLRGQSLDDRLQRQGRLPLAEVLRIGRETALGLAAAHERGLVHRDVKPANLWLEGEHGRVKILDFGLAKGAQDSAHLTQTGLIIGTPAYMAPEQARGSGVDSRADLFSLGCVLYRCCTGRLPFEGTDTISILAALALDNPPPPRQLNARVPPGLSSLIMRLLAKDPAQRPASAQAVADCLSAPKSLAAVPVPPAAAKPRPPSSTLPARSSAVIKVLPVEPARPSQRGSARPPAQSRSGRKRRGPRGKRWWPWAVAAVLLVVLGPLACWCAPTVIRIATNKGQLVIETDDPDVEVRVKQNGEQVTILDARTSKEVTLKAGVYELELVPGKDGLGLSARQFTLARGGREIVKVQMEPVRVAASGPASAPAKLLASGPASPSPDASTPRSVPVAPPPPAKERAAAPPTVPELPRQAPPAKMETTITPPSAPELLPGEKVPAPLLTLRPRMLRDMIDGVGPRVNESVRGAALAYPYAYVTRRHGGLWVFKLPPKTEAAAGQVLQEVNFLPNAGDGNALIIIGSTLLCSSHGGLEAFALNDPVKPRFLGRCGPPQRTTSQSLVHSRDRVILIGPGHISVFNVSAPARPQYLGTMSMQGMQWNGCVLGDNLFVAEVQDYRHRNSRNGISVFDLRRSTRLREQAFFPEAPYYHLLPVGADRFVALTSKTAVLFRVVGGRPTVVGKPVATSGRSGAILSSDGRSYLITSTDVMRIEDSQLVPLTRYQGEITYDGDPYPASVQGEYALIPGSMGVRVLRAQASLSTRLDKQLGVRGAALEPAVAGLPGK